MKFVWMLLAMSIAPPAQADTQFWEYKDWRVVVEAFDTGEDWRVNCTAATGGDGDPSLSISASNGDAGPPDLYPQPAVQEHAIRGYDTMMQDGNRVLFEIDNGWSTEGFVNRWLDEDGFAHATATAHQGDSLSMLQSMREASTMFITLDGEVVYEASLSGFTAAYGKIAEQCGFSAVGVID